MKQSVHFGYFWQDKQNIFRNWPQRVAARAAYKEALDHALAFVDYAFVLNALDENVDIARKVLHNKLAEELDENTGGESSTFCDYYNNDQASHAVQNLEKLVHKFYVYGLQEAFDLVEGAFFVEPDDAADRYISDLEKAREVFSGHIETELQCNESH